MPAEAKPAKGTTSRSRTRAKANEARQWLVLRAIVYDRDQGRCRACLKPVKFTSNWHFDVGHAHHLVFRSRGGQDERQNVIMLCTVCHDAVHAHRLTITGDGDGEIQQVWT